MKNLIYLLSIFSAALLFSCGGQKETTAQVMKTTDINQMPEPGPAPKIHFQKPQTFVLDNGLRVILVENHKLPRVTASLRMDNQPFNLYDKKGSDDLLASLLGSGSENVSKDDFNEKIDYYGARVNIHDGGFYINALSKYFPKVLDLTVDQALHPKFTKEEFEKKKKELIEGLKMDEKSTPAAANRVMKKLAYGKHPYGEFTTIETAKNVQLPDVLDYYKKVYIPNHAYLIIVGDVKLDEVKKMVDKNFKSWKPAHQTRGRALPRINNPMLTEVDFVNMPEAAQAELKVVHRSDIQMANPDYQKVLLMNSILGGDFNSYLNMTLREKHGWTYGVRSRFGTDKYGDLFTASTSVRNSVADSATVVTMEQLNKIRNEKVSDTLLHNTKEKFMGNFVLQMENPQTIARQAYNIYVNNLPEDFYETFLQKVDAVTVDDIQTVAQKYLHPDKARIILAGKASDIVPGLKKNGFNVKFYDKYGNPTQAPVTKTLPADLKPQHVLDHYFAAIGGKDKVKNIQSIEAVYEGNVQGTVLQIIKKAKAPNKEVMETQAMGMTMQKIVFDGEKGYMEVQGQKRDLPAEMIKEYKEKTEPFPLLGLYKTAKLKEMETIDGMDYYVLEDGDTVYYFDTKTGFLTKQIKTKTMNGNSITQVVEFKDYTEKNGIKMPGKIVQSFGPQKIELKLKDIKFNTVTDEDFK